MSKWASDAMHGADELTNKASSKVDVKWHDKPAPRWFTYGMHCLLMAINPRRERLRWATIQRERAGQRLNKSEAEREAFREKLRQSLKAKD